MDVTHSYSQKCSFLPCLLPQSPWGSQEWCKRGHRLSCWCISWHMQAMNYQGKRVNYPVLKETRAAVALGPSAFTKSFHGEQRWGAKGLQTDGKSVRTHIHTHTLKKSTNLSASPSRRQKAHFEFLDNNPYLQIQWFLIEISLRWKSFVPHFFFFPLKIKIGSD